MGASVLICKMHPKLSEVTALSTRFKRIQPERHTWGFSIHIPPLYKGGIFLNETDFLEYSRY